MEPALLRLNPVAPNKSAKSPPADTILSHPL